MTRTRRSQPKTLHITNAFHDSSGGIQTFYRALLSAAAAEDRQIRLVVPGDRTRVEQIGRSARIYHIAAPRSPVFDRRYRLFFPHMYAAPYASSLRKILQDEQPDLVEVCDKYLLSFLPSVIRQGWVPRLKRSILVGMSCERMDDNVAAFIGQGESARAFAKWYMRCVYAPRFDYHIANSSYTAAEIVQASPANLSHRIFVRPMGVDDATFSRALSTPVQRERVAGLAGGGGGSRILIYAGRLSPEKNLKLLVDTFERLVVSDSHHDYRLILAGAGPAQSKLMAEIHERVPGRTAFLGHISSRSELAELYANCDVFVHPNPREPFGIAPLEAMAAGLPVVGPSEGGVLSYLNPGNGWPVEPRAEAFAGAVREVLLQSTLTRRRIEAARQTARNHRWDRSAEKLFSLYDELLSDSSTS